MGKAQRFAAGAEEDEQRVEEDPEHQSEQHAEHRFQQYGMAQHAARLRHVLAAELDGAQRRAAHGHKLTEGHEQVHQRKGDGHGGKGEVSHAVPDEDA